MVDKSVLATSEGVVVGAMLSKDYSNPDPEEVRATARSETTFSNSNSNS